MSFRKCCTYIDEHIFPYADFLHTPNNFPLTKKATTSYLGILFSFIMILIFIILVYIDIISIYSNYKISYFQDFMPISDWNGKNITIGFNVSENWTNKIEFFLQDAEGKDVNFTRCNENLIESEKGVYHCIVNYSLKIDYDTAHVLKLFLYLKQNESEYDENNPRVPFSLVVREPKFDHDNLENPLGSISDSPVRKFRCFFNISEITAYRRYLKYIKYRTIRKIIDWRNSTNESIYLDDFEDSRKSIKVDRLIGIYRILASKKFDIYERKYIYLTEFFSQMGGYIGSLMTIFKILTLFFVNPNDNYRIINYLKKKKQPNHFDTDLKNIYEDAPMKKDIESNDFNKVLEEKRFCPKFYTKLCYIFCRCFHCSYRKTQALSIVRNYIEENLTIENYLESQIFNKTIISKMDKELKDQNLTFSDIRQTGQYSKINDEDSKVDDNSLKDNLLIDKNIEMGNYKNK